MISDLYLFLFEVHVTLIQSLFDSLPHFTYLCHFNCMFSLLILAFSLFSFIFLIFFLTLILITYVENCFWQLPAVPKFALRKYVLDKLSGKFVVSHFYNAFILFFSLFIICCPLCILFIIYLFTCQFSPKIPKSFGLSLQTLIDVSPNFKSA